MGSARLYGGLAGAGDSVKCGDLTHEYVSENADYRS
jgi:N-acetylglutamate synthase/N-acetylornithine aminotransferase